MKKPLLTICLFVILILIFSSNIFACECFEHFRPPIVDYSKSDAVFIGKVIDVKKITNEPKEVNWKENRVVTFEILKNYKEFNFTTKRVALNTYLNSGSCGLGETPKRGQKWIVFARKNKKDSRLNFGGTCSPSTYLESDSDILDYEKSISFIQEKQAIIGSVVDFTEIKGIKGIEVILKGKGQTLKTQTNEGGLYYFPLSFNGIYKITINMPFTNFFVFDSSFREIQESENNANSLTNIRQKSLTYEIELKPNQFNYNEIQIVKTK